MNKYHVYTKNNDRRYIEANFFEIDKSGAAVFYDDSAAPNMVAAFRDFEIIIPITK